MTPPPELLASIDADPTALEARRVLGDWYQSQGDPLGELIAVQVALLEAGDSATQELRDRESSLFAAHRERLFGPLYPRAGGRGAHVQWFAGSWRAIELRETMVDLSGVLSHPLARWVTGLAAQQTLPLNRLELRTIRQLSLEAFDHVTQILPSGRLQPRLESFRFEGSSVRLLEAPPLGLSQLRLKGRPTGPLGVNSLSGADELIRVSWPVLSRLSIEAVVSEAALGAFFEADRFPRLNHLRLQMLGGGAWDVLAHVKRSPPLLELELFDPNLRKANALEWISRAFPVLGKVRRVSLYGTSCFYEGPGDAVLRGEDWIWR
ncbi:MAG: hypothetical protein QM723_11830 [Myxococcaceae bacterium]